jgi:PIN domain nuclease of toxin-antitoxin system
MRILLDTCTFLWIVKDAPELSDVAREVFVNPGNEVYLSAVSTWGITIANTIGRLPLPETVEKFIPTQREEHGVASLALQEEVSLHPRRLPEMHKDPFDRLLICQAIVYGLVILTSDELIMQYPIRCIW